MIGESIITPGEVLQIILQPAFITSAYRPVVFRIQDTTPGHPEMIMKGELYVRNDITLPFTLVATKYEKLAPGMNYFQFNFAQNLATMLSFDRQNYPALSLVSPNNNSIVEYQVKFTEVYLDPDDTMQEYYSIFSEILKAVQATRQHLESLPLTDYIIYGGNLPGIDTPSFSRDFNSSFGH